MYQGTPGLIRVKTGLFFLRSRVDWVTFVTYVHGFARVGFGQVLTLPGFGQVGLVWFADVKRCRFWCCSWQPYPKRQAGLTLCVNIHAHMYM